MTEEVGADPTLECTRETEAQVARDTPAQVARDTPAQTDTLAEIGTQVEDAHLTATEPRAVRLTQRLSNNRPPTPYTRHNSRSRSS